MLMHKWKNTNIIYQYHTQRVKNKNVIYMARRRRARVPPQLGNHCTRHLHMLYVSWTQVPKRGTKSNSPTMLDEALDEKSTHFINSSSHTAKLYLLLLPWQWWIIPTSHSFLPSAKIYLCLVQSSQCKHTQNAHSAVHPQTLITRLWFHINKGRDPQTRLQ